MWILRDNTAALYEKYNIITILRSNIGAVQRFIDVKQKGLHFEHVFLTACYTRV